MAQHFTVNFKLAIKSKYSKLTLTSQIQMGKSVSWRLKSVDNTNLVFSPFRVRGFTILENDNIVAEVWRSQEAVSLPKSPTGSNYAKVSCPTGGM